MRLLSNKDCKIVDNLLRAYNTNIPKTENYSKAMEEIIAFFDIEIYKQFLDVYYFNRFKYKNRCPDNRSLFAYLMTLLYLQEPTLFAIRKEIRYKSAMIFYKYGLID